MDDGPIRRPITVTLSGEPGVCGSACVPGRSHLPGARGYPGFLFKIVLGTVILVAGLVLALDVRGLGTAWVKADLRFTRTASDEVVERRVKRRHYFWVLVALGAVTLIVGIF
jgi:hypothetical protein